MRYHLRSPTLLSALCVALCVACTHSAPSTLPLAFTPCPVSGLGPVDSSWRQVRASGFSFCIPGSWRPTRPASDSLDARAWRGKEGSLTWDLGRPASISPSDTVMVITATIMTVGGMPPPANPTQPTRQPKPCLPSSSPTHTSFIVDSVIVVVTQAACRSTWMTTAWSTAPAIYVQGEAHSPKEARLLNAIMVTIRFASPRP